MDKSQKGKHWNIKILQKPEIEEQRGILKNLNIVFKSLKYGRKRNQFHGKIVRGNISRIKFLLV